MDTDELREVYKNAEELKGSAKGMEKLGYFCTAHRDIILFKDQNGKFYYVSNKVWD